MGKLRYTDLADNPKALLAHTGLKPAEFNVLCHAFDEVWKRHARYYTLEGKPRVRQSGWSIRHRSRKNEILPRSEDKLLFVLYYLNWRRNIANEPFAGSTGRCLRDVPTPRKRLAETVAAPARRSACGH